MSDVRVILIPEKDVMPDFSVRSFFIAIYDKDLEKLRPFQIPVAAIAPFANRIAKEVLDLTEWGRTQREYWYSIVHKTKPDFQREPKPEGPTDLYGHRYQPTDGEGFLVQLHPDAIVRSFVVRLYDYQTELFRGEYGVTDIFQHGADYLLSNGIKKGLIPPDRGPYYYEIIPSSEPVRSLSSDIFPEDAYKVEGVFRLPPRVGNEPRIAFKAVAEPPFPERKPDEFPIAAAHGKGEPMGGRVVIPESLHAQLHSQLTLSHRNEEGGYLLGNVYRQPGSPENEDDPDYRWVVEITDLLMAEDTLGTAATLLFTGDSWSKISRRRDRDHAGRKLVGWFHTHLFPATDDFGLSGIDQDMHAWYLPKPWQIAILLNLEDDGTRTVRCYQRGKTGDLVECRFGIVGKS
uniref:JAB domain-containing protein n=1 Tax=Candidatus Kentrum sp. FM TaxID=2126340 RepID=A0A450SDN8_9GAMM|nr:MAG: hypothetical protein BECKFM1743C_GA0114222_100886 [Candidatus Kentron sp. FM]VFJ50749.1 MAG: hypothetical protein BECKFM1743A_GA0114220_100876 [Candidatus Kentron sp. FM]VFK08750.1 MAG: hypothetical protein BECKFM1743B_GA0114221_100806 [Candidatus Kentron sp. FM]